MGNTKSRSRSYSDAGSDNSQKRRKKPSRSQSASQVDGRNNRLSMPELGGAVPYDPRDDVDVDITIHRSYGDLLRPKTPGVDATDFKFYRKSTEPIQKYATLPRHFGRSKSAAISEVPNGTMRDYKERRRQIQSTPDYPEIMPRRRSPVESLSSGSQKEEAPRISKRMSTASSFSSLARAPVTSDDFPSTAEVRRKLKCFEDQFCRSLADKYAGLADTLQLSALPIALARGSNDHYDYVKLLDYLQGDSVPLDLLDQDPDDFIVMVPDALIHGIMHVRRDKISDLDLWTTLARDLVTCVAVEAASEISRMFEYQIVLLAGDTAVRVLADHAASCVIEYVKKTSSYLDRNTAVIGAVRGQPQVTAGAPKYISVILGNRELKWEVRDVFRRPGLRKELYLFSSEVDEFGGLYSPWYYYTHKDCDPQLYGYRTLMLEWDFINRVYKVNEQDLAQFSEDISDPADYPDDFHRLYSPFRLLFGADVMIKYNELKAKDKTQDSLVQFLNDMTGGERSEVQPVYRPLVAPPEAMNFNTMNLDNVDLTRAQLRRADLSKASIRNCKLLLTDLDGAQFEDMEGNSNAQLTGTDVSYTNLMTSTLDQAALDGVTAKHVVVVRPRQRKKKGRTPPGDNDGPTEVAPVNGGGVDDVFSQDIQTTPVNVQMRSKKRKVPKTLNIASETNGHKETDIDGLALVNGQDVQIDAGQADAGQADAGQEESSERVINISDSRGNILDVAQADKMLTSEERRAARRSKRMAKSVIETGINTGTGSNREPDRQSRRARTSKSDSRSHNMNKPKQHFEQEAGFINQEAPPSGKHVHTRQKRRDSKLKQIDNVLGPDQTYEDDQIFNNSGHDDRVIINVNESLSKRHHGDHDGSYISEGKTHRRKHKHDDVIDIRTHGNRHQDDSLSRRTNQHGGQHEMDIHHTYIDDRKPRDEYRRTRSKEHRKVAPSHETQDQFSADSVASKAKPRRVKSDVTDAQLIEQKQHKVRERKKKAKKRPVGPIASTPTEPIPEADTAHDQEDVIITQYTPPQEAPVPQVRVSKQAPPRETIVDQTEEFFRESRSQYEPGRHSVGEVIVPVIAAPQTQQGVRPASVPTAPHTQQGVRPTSVPIPAPRRTETKQYKGEISPTAAPQITITAPAETVIDDAKVIEDPKTNKKTKKVEKSKSGKTKDKKPEKKRKKSRSRTPERDVTTNGKDLLNGSHFDAIDATPIGVKSPGKALSTTDIHQRHTVIGVVPQQAHSQEDVLQPRMTKSLSHHGNLTTGRKLHNLSFDSCGVGLRTARQIYGLSREEIEFITRSQIFNMIKGLQIDNIKSNVPEVAESFVGRERELDDLTEMLSSPGRIVTMAGSYGSGKSCLAAAVGHEINKKFIVPVLVDARGCQTSESIFLRLVATFGLHFRYKELNFFYNWINCHEQRLLFIFDNVDIGLEEDSSLSSLLDNMIDNVKDLRVLCSSRRHFFKGVASHEVYRLGNAQGFSLKMLRELLPDLHEEGHELLQDVCMNNPYVINMVSRAFALDDIDSGKLFEDLVDSGYHALLEDIEGSLRNVAQDEGEMETLRALAACLLKVQDNIPIGHTELLQKASHFTASFDAKSLAALAERMDVAEVTSVLDEMKEVGLVLGVNADRYYLASLVKLVNQSKIDERGSDNLVYYQRTLNDIQSVCAKYHSINCKDALNAFRDNFDNYIHVFNKVIDREDTYEFCPNFATLDYALFLSEVMPEDVYINFYESLAQESDDQADLLTQCRALCCLSHRLAVEDSLSAAKHAVDRAYDLVHTHELAGSDIEQAFCLRCMAKIVWENSEDRVRALIFAKKSLDLYRKCVGAKDVQTIHTTELYARMLTQKESYQTARHFYNVSDLFTTEILNEHPLLIEGYNCRRVIWDGICLFQRASDMAKKAVSVSKYFYGEHPITARMLANLCEAIVKRGSLNDAIKAGIEALSIRSKVLGDHQETGESYKKLAYLMLRSGQYDEAARFGDSAVDIFEKVKAPERLTIDAKNVVAQARLRLEYKSHVFVQIPSRDAQKQASPIQHTEV